MTLYSDSIDIPKACFALEGSSSRRSIMSLQRVSSVTDN